jgi:acetyl-CoA carboxylase alpha subunit
MSNEIKQSILSLTKELETKTAEKRIKERIDKFGNMGVFKE